MAIGRAAARTAGARDGGAALLEIAIMIPLLLTIGLGVIEFGNYLYDYQLIQNGVRDAARYAASLPYDSAHPSNNDAAIKNLAVTGVPTGGTLRLSWWNISAVTVTWGTVANPALPGGTQSYRYSGPVPVVKVSTAVVYSSLGFLGYLGITSLAVNASHQERVIGVR